MKLKDIFQVISYLQYPLILVASYYIIDLYIELFSGDINNFDWSIYAENLNGFLLFAGISLSLSTLQDTKKTQNNFSRKIWQSRRKSRFFLMTTLFFALLMIISGILFHILFDFPFLEEVSTGIMVLGIGFLGIVRAGLEMAEYQQSLVAENNN